jgi:hypothetical protein
MIDVKDRTGFPSPYEAAYNEGWDIKNTGYDYTNTLVNKVLSSYLFKNPTLSTFLTSYLNPILVSYINNVKYLRIFYNYAVPKNYQNIN